MRKIGVTAVALCMLVLLASCSGSQNVSSSSASTSSSVSSSSSSAQAVPARLENCPVIYDSDSGGAYIDMTIDEFNARGFAFGDSLDVTFSNGYALEDLPYYSGYYAQSGMPLVVGYPGYPHVKICVNNGGPLWDTAALTESDTATIVTRERGKYSDMQEAYSISYTENRSDYSGDEVFANFRSLSGGKIKRGTFYRSASPVDNEHNRASYVSALASDAGIRFILDLSDNNDEINKFLKQDEKSETDVSYFRDLFESGNVLAIDLDSNYRSAQFAAKLANGLIELTKHDGPYLTHCIEGKDRTGFVCAVIEACAGATYQEILDDYMITYENYYGITKDTDRVKYEAIANLHLHAMLRHLAGVDKSADLSALDYVEPARAYLRSGGMTDEQIDLLLNRICN